MSITAEYLKENLHYDRDSGRFKWVAGARAGMPAGCSRSGGYVVIRIKGVLHYAHRLAWLYVTGELPKQQIDHRNCIKSDNRFINLRDVSSSENSQNQHLPHKGGTASGVRGVQKNHNGWQALLMRAGKRVCLGTYQTVSEAKEAYLAEKKKFSS